jgi:hypothetical protein
MSAAAVRAAVMSAVAVAAFAHPASAAPLPPTEFLTVQFSTSTVTPEWQAAHSVYRSVPDTALQVARIATDINGNPSIAVRIVSPSACDRRGCVTTIIENRSRGWQEIFSRHTVRLEVGNLPRSPLENNGSALVRVDGREVWMMEPGGQYSAMIDGLGAPVDWLPNVEPRLQASAPDASRQGFAAVGGIVGRLMLIGFGNCDDRFGCVTIGVKPGVGRPMFEGRSLNGIIAVGGHIEQGAHDLLVTVPQGYDTWRWNGQQYVLAETSYPSPTTRSP